MSMADGPATPYEPPQAEPAAGPEQGYRTGPADAFGIDPVHLPEAMLRAIRIGLGIAAGFSLILGVALLVWPGRTLAVGGVLLGLNFLVIGVVRIALGVFGSAYSGGMRALSIIMGLLLVLGGVVTLRNLTAATAVLLMIITIMIGIGWIIDGIATLADSDRARSRGWAIAMGIISLIAGIAVVATPAWSTVWLLTFAAIAMVILGIVGLVRAFTLGRAKRS